jgi:DNA (cytosine-5)-methyltransferase 1
MQMSLFDGTKPFKIDKPIRLIELFAGYGSQHLALKYLGANVESHRICEWAVKSIQAYKDLHCAENNTDYAACMPIDKVIDYLADKGISANYNEPMTKEQIKRMGEQKCREVFNNIMATHNLVNIMQANGEDLAITDTDKYTYIMTYSFPCQDLSNAGKGAGMEKGSGTRSGLLWEVERLLDELYLSGKELPQVLLMENVPEVIGTKNIKHFAKWLEKLESLGYKSKWELLNAKDYGIPQNRNCCFMVSILGDYYYDFPKPIKLEHRLKDMLETEVDEKYYLSDTALNGVVNTSFNSASMQARTERGGVMPTLLARDYKDPKLVIEDDTTTNSKLE